MILWRSVFCAGPAGGCGGPKIFGGIIPGGMPAPSFPPGRGPIMDMRAARGLSSGSAVSSDEAMGCCPRNDLGPLAPPMSALNSCCCCSSDHMEGSGLPAPSPVAEKGDCESLALRDISGGVGSIVSSPTNCRRFVDWGMGARGGSASGLHVKIWNMQQETCIRTVMNIHRRVLPSCRGRELLETVVFSAEDGGFPRCSLLSGCGHGGRRRGTGARFTDVPPMTTARDACIVGARRGTCVVAHLQRVAHLSPFPPPRCQDKTRLRPTGTQNHSGIFSNDPRIKYALTASATVRVLVSWSTRRGLTLRTDPRWASWNLWVYAPFERPCPSDCM